MNLRRLSDVEVLEERDVEVASSWSPNVERRLRWSSIREARNGELAQIVDLVSQLRTADLRIAKVDRCHRTQTRAGIGTVKRVGSIPTQGIRSGRNVAGESQTNRNSALDGCDTRDLPTIENTSGDRVGKTTPRNSRYTPVVREIEYVRAIERQHAPASVSGVDWIGPCRSIALVGSHGSQGLGKRISCKVLEVSSVVAQRSL